MRGRGPREQDRGGRDGQQYRRPRYRDEDGPRDRGRRHGDESRQKAPHKAPRRPGGPELPDDIKATDLDSDVRAELVSLPRPAAETVARHLIATGRLIDEEPALALEHAMAARRLAPRIAAVREAVGLAAYHAEDWPTAISELRTYQRLSGRPAHLAVLADCERALGRPERAIDLYRGADRSRLDTTEAIELLIVAAGARADLGQHAAAVAMLQVRELGASTPRPAVARLRYAFADALLAVGRREEAREWFSRAVDADEDATTDAAERLLELDGVLLYTDEEDDAVDDDTADEDTADEDTADEDTVDDDTADEDTDGDEDADDEQDTDAGDTVQDGDTRADQSQ